MIDHMEIFDGAIQYFDESEYLAMISDNLKMHRDRIIDHYSSRKEYFDEWLAKAESYYVRALLAAINTPQRESMINTLNEIRGRVRFNEAEKLIAQITVDNKISLASLSLDNSERKLDTINSLLLASLDKLPPTCEKARNLSLNALRNIAPLWKELGNQNFKKGLYSKAIELYEKGIIAYQNPLFANESTLEELTLSSNIVLSLRKLNQNAQAMHVAKEAILKYPEDQTLLPVKQKLLFNLIKALEETRNSSPEQESQLKDEWSDLLDQHKELLNKEASKIYSSLFCEEISKDKSSSSSRLPSYVTNRELFFGSEISGLLPQAKSSFKPN